MNSGKKKFLVPLLIVCILGNLFSLAYLVVNTMETVKYFQTAAVVDENDTADNTTEDKEGVSNPTGDGKAYMKVGYSFFQLISIDRSSIAPGLLLWFFLSIAVCSYRSLMIPRYHTEDDSRMEVPSTPFPPSYAITWVQLGFIGTLWGFMLIGIKMRDATISEAGENVLDILLRAFETALFSTFVAVVLVYVFSPLVIRLWRWIHDLEIEPESVDADIENQLQSLSKGLKKTTLSVTILNAEIGKLKNKISKLSPDEVVKTLSEIAVDIKTVSGLGDVIRGTRDSVMQATPTIMQRIEQAEISIINKTEFGVNILSKNLGVDIIPENGESMRSEIRAGQNKTNEEFSKLKEKIDPMEDNITKEIRAGQNKTNEEFSKLKEKIDPMEDNITKEIRAGQDKTNKELSTLKEKVDPMEDNITKVIKASQGKTNEVLSKVNMQKISLMRKDETAPPGQGPNFPEKKTKVDRFLKFFRIK